MKSWIDLVVVVAFLAIVLARIEDEYALPGFAASFTADFEAFLASVDLDDTTPGNQPYTDPLGAPILTLADTLWFGPAQTWPRELPNHPYIHFWHRLDAALQSESIPGMASEILGDAAWTALFTSGPLAENPDIVATLWSQHAYSVGLLGADQLGRARPVGGMGDVGAIERR